VTDFATALLEPLLPETSLQERTLMQIGLGESGPWRTGWNADLGHALMEPPRPSEAPESYPGGTVGHALLGGLIWLGVLKRVNRSDPSLRAGIGAMARRGDPAAAYLHEFLVLDQGLAATVDATFEPWTLPLLWTRPDPMGWTPGSEGGHPLRKLEADEPVRPDLGGNNLAVVTSGDIPGVLAAWGEGNASGKWRIVLDRLDRLPQLSGIAARVAGPVTLIPAGGLVHGLQPALDLLESLLSRQGRPAGRVDGLIPIFHWVRLVETHNGDLLDFRQIRPRPQGEPPLYGRYAATLAHLPRLAPTLDDGEEHDPWANQFAQRVRRAGLVAGLGDCLSLQAATLDSLWGVFEGSGVSWVFLDSAVIHWHLYGQGKLGVQELHALLHSRGDRHLSMLTGALWRRSELEDLLGTWLQVYGTPYCLALADLQPPPLRLPDSGVVPDATELAVEAHAASVAQATRSLETAGGGVILLPRHGSLAALWRAVAEGELDLAGPNWDYLDPGQSGPSVLPGQPVGKGAGWLVVPQLDSLAGEAAPIAHEDSPEAWARADEDRQQYLSWRRRLCGLELASILAGPWEGIEVLDVRWWRLVPPASAADSSGVEPPLQGQSWSGRSALPLACPHGCRLFDLPGPESPHGAAIHPNVQEKVRHWLNGRGGDRPPLPSGKPALHLPGEGAVVTSHSVAGLWEILARSLGRNWELGRLDSWLLLVGNEVPASAAAQVAAGFAPGLSVWTGEPPFLPPAPVLWCRAADLLDPALNLFLRENPPWTILLSDVQDLLPVASAKTADSGLVSAAAGDVGASALRTVFRSPARRLILQTEPLPGAWLQFLLSEGGAVVLEAAEGSSLDSPEDPDAPSIIPAILAEPRLPDLDEEPGPRVTLRRLRQLFQNLRPALLPRAEESAENRPALARDQLISLDQLSFLAGVSGDRLAAGFQVLRWAARLSGDFLSDAAGQSAGVEDKLPGVPVGRGSDRHRGTPCWWRGVSPRSNTSCWNSKKWWASSCP
jgi:hypothetical protein